jgi:hypothetical protein
MHVKYKQDNFTSYDMIHRYVQDNSHKLTIHVNFLADAALLGNHYRTNIISGVGHPMSDSIVLLVLCTVTYNIQGTGIILEVPWNSTKPSGKR